MASILYTYLVLLPLYLTLLPPSLPSILHLFLPTYFQPFAFSVYTFTMLRKKIIKTVLHKRVNVMLTLSDVIERVKVFYFGWKLEQKPDTLFCFVDLLSYLLNGTT